MKNKNGFTLVELLVVVLIVGILAAIAVPQYQKAIEKSKGMQAITLLRTIGEASNYYYLSSGKWPSSLSELVIDIPTWAGSTHLYPGIAHSTQDWNVLEMDGGGYRMERLSGSYRGAGFQWNTTSPNPATNPVGEIICREHASFVTKPGSYCEKIFKGKKTPWSGVSRVYTLP